ncbi:MAG: transporter permease [Glaciihabitans sp.]|jgi:ABC-type uncharacterized transport system permease subunit|nr:transporter permease [Glaciihabitans sp.]MDQ1571845.1 ral nucleoside transport system permease protein [Actinomycetota bacterium]
MTVVAERNIVVAGPTTVVIKSWKIPIILGAFALLALVLFVILGRNGTTTFILAEPTDFLQVAPIGIPVRASGIVATVLLAAFAVLGAWFVRSRGRVPLWIDILFGFVFLVEFLTWAAAPASVQVPGMLLQTIALSVPLIFGALGGVISERVGVVNIAIEGQLLAGAFVSAMIASITHQPLLGLIGAMVAGVLVSFILAAFSIKYLVDQVIVGVVINVFIVGLTNFLYSTVLSESPELLNSPPRFEAIDIPVLSQIPVIGPTFFRQSLIVYLVYVAVPLVWFGLFHTRWGLRLRAVGEHPQAADTVGINVTRTRFWNVSLAGAIAGLGGAFFTLGSVGAFSREMTGGQGYIALAAVIFGRWDPIRATVAALLFGFANELQYVLQDTSPIPSEFMLMLPYVVTILAVAGLVGQVRGPAASGKPYIKS